MKTYLYIALSVIFFFIPRYAGGAESSRYDSIFSANSEKSIDTLTKLGYRTLERGDYDEALALYSLVIAKGDDSLRGDQRREYIKALNNVGYIYLFDRCNPEMAYPYFLHAQRLAEEAQENALLSATLDNIAKIHADFGDAEKAIDIYNRAMTYAVKEDSDVSRVIQIMVLNDIINCGLANDMVLKIAPGLALFSSLPEYTGMPLGKYSKAMCAGMTALLDGNLVEATQSVKNAGVLIDAKVDSARYVADHHLLLSNLYHLRHMEDSACYYLDMALTVADKHGLYDHLPRIYRGMAEVAGTRGDSVESNRMKLLAYEADERIHSSKMYAALATLETSQKIDDLNMELRESNIKNAHRITVIWILVIAFAMVGSLLAVIIKRNRTLDASHRELVARYRASVAAEEVNAHLRREYEETIISLQNKLERCHPKDIDETDDVSQEKGFVIPVNVNERFSIIGRVNDIFANSGEIYDNDFSLERLAELTDTKPRYLSALLNEGVGKSFNVMLAERRINRACELLLSPEFKKTMTIEGIAKDVGYKSRTHFISVFKKITGVTPVQYASMAV